VQNEGKQNTKSSIGMQITEMKRLGARIEHDGETNYTVEV